MRTKPDEFIAVTGWAAREDAYFSFLQFLEEQDLELGDLDPESDIRIDFADVKSPPRFRYWVRKATLEALRVPSDALEPPGEGEDHPTAGRRRRRGGN